MRAALPLCTVGLLLLATACATSLPLWRVESGPGRLYVIGTVHAMHTAAGALPVEFDRAFDQAEAILVEVDPGRAPSARLDQLLNELGTYAPGDGLKRHLSPRTWSLLTDAATARRLDLAGLEHRQPWLIALQLEQRGLLEAGFDPNLGVERQLLRRLRQDQRLVEMETFESQLRHLAPGDARLQEQLLQNALEAMPRVDRDLKTLVRAWRRGDLTAMEQQARAGLDDQPSLRAYYDDMLRARNRAMLAQIELALRTHRRSLVMVGALHLPGPEGLLRQLEASHSVRQLRRGDRID